MRAKRSGSGVLVAVLLGAALLAACGSGSVKGASAPPAAIPAAPTTSTSVAPTIPPATTSTTSTTVRRADPAAVPSTSVPAPHLAAGDSGPAVLALQRRLTALGYWLGSPNGFFGDSTQEAVFALQKAAGIARDGVVGPATESALAHGVVPSARSSSGYEIEVDLHDDLLLFVDNGRVRHVLNTSTGGGYTYRDGDSTAVAVTPEGVFHLYRQVDGMVTDSLGQLWRPKFFYSGFAIHGDGYVPAYPASHGCVRVSNEAIDWIWADGLAPIGTTVWIYS